MLRTLTQHLLHLFYFPLTSFFPSPFHSQKLIINSPIKILIDPNLLHGPRRHFDVLLKREIKFPLGCVRINHEFLPLTTLCIEITRQPQWLAPFIGIDITDNLHTNGQKCWFWNKVNLGLPPQWLTLKGFGVQSIGQDKRMFSKMPGENRSKEISNTRERWFISSVKNDSMLLLSVLRSVCLVLIPGENISTSAV